MHIEEIHRRNAAWWDENANWYAERDEASEIEFFRHQGNHLFESEKLILGDLSSWCGRAIHLQCSDGRDVFSLLNMGAQEVVGVDISERLLAVAKRKARALTANASFVRSDILEAPHELDATADLVYTGKGALCWMMDLDAWASVAARLLKPGGMFFILEGHPLDWVWDKDAADYQLDAVHGNYFATTPRTRLFTATTQTKPRYRQWTLAAIVNSLVEAGLVVERLEEYSEPFWNQFPRMSSETVSRLPHTFAIKARRRPGPLGAT